MRQVVIKTIWKYADVTMTLLTRRDFGVGRGFEVVMILSIFSKMGGLSRLLLTR